MRHTASLSLPSIGPVRAAAPESEPFAIAANRQQPDALPALTPQRLPTSPIASARLEGAVVAAHPRRPSQEPTRPSGALELARRRRIVGLQISPVLIATEHTESDVMIGATAISHHAVPKDGNKFFFRCICRRTVAGGCPTRLHTGRNAMRRRSAPQNSFRSTSHIFGTRSCTLAVKPHCAL